MDQQILNMLFCRAAEASGLRTIELARIYGVDRRTVYDWLHGVVPRQAFLLRAQETYSQALLSAVQKGVLPLKPGVVGAERRQRVEAIAAVLRRMGAQ